MSLPLVIYPCAEDSLTCADISDTANANTAGNNIFLFIL